MLPNGWSKLKVINILEKVSLPVNVDPNKEYFEIGIRSHGKGIFYKEPLKGKTIGDKRVFHIEPNCLILNIVFAWELAIAKTTEHERGMIASHRFPMFRPKNNMCDVDYVLYLFKTKLGKNLLGLASPGGAGRNKTLGQKEFNDLGLVLPPLPEQIKVVEILSTWDNAINTMQKLLTNSQEQKKALMQQLLTGKKRFAEFEGEWEEKRLSRLLKVTGGNAFKSESFADTGVPLIKISNIKTDFSVSVDSCVFHPYEQEFAKFNVQYGDILIAMSGATTGKVGRYFGERLCYLNQRVGRFDLKKELASPDFIFQILKLPYIQHEILIDAVGGAQPNISNKEIERIKIKAPSLAEQQKIAAVLTTADQEIDNLRAQLNHLKQEKKALMQQLLTGKRRVKVEEAA